MPFTPLPTQHVTFTQDSGADTFALVIADYPDKVTLAFLDEDAAWHIQDVPKDSDRLKVTLAFLDEDAAWHIQDVPKDSDRLKVTLAFLDEDAAWHIQDVPKDSDRLK
jgi:hypothetical protein